MTDTPETDAMEYFDAMCDPDRVVEAGFARKLERERDMARAAANTFRQCAEVTFGPMPFPRKFHWENADILDQTRNERDEWKAKYIQQNKELNALAYWRDISECDCHNPLPNGGCLRCDLDKIFNATENK
jgi:hypothetical protein